MSIVAINPVAAATIDPRVKEAGHQRRERAMVRQAYRRMADALPELQPQFRTAASIKPLAEPVAFPWALAIGGVLSLMAIACAVSLLARGEGVITGMDFGLQALAMMLGGGAFVALGLVVLPGDLLQLRSNQENAAFSAVLVQGRPAMSSCTNIAHAFGDYSPIAGTRISVTLPFRPDLERLEVLSARPVEYDARIEGAQLVIDFAHFSGSLPIECRIVA